jgi:hypothetical protein
MKSRAAWAYLEGFGPIKSILDLDPFTAHDIMVQLDPEREDSLLNPWKRAYNPAMRKIRNH